MFTRNRSIAVIVFMVVGLMGTGWMVGSDHVQAVGDDYATNMRLLQQVASQIRTKYVDEINAKEAIDSAIRGMLDALDPYTEFLEKKQNDEMKMMQIEGKYGGLGIKITKQDDALEVVALFDDTPAYNAGIQTGDRIVKIEDQSTAELDVNQAADLLRGKPGTLVTISIRRDDTDNELEYAITRAVITIPVVPYAGIIHDHIGYIKLYQFTEEAGIEVERALKRLKTQGAEGIVLDLRHNPGGLLEQAVSVAGKFLDENTLVVYTKGRDKEQDKQYHAASNFVVRDLPLVVMVDEYSASASEIVAGAIQDWDRGVVVGTTTFGKALVQQIFPMSNGTALKITTARYYTPSGRLIQKIGSKGRRNTTGDPITGSSVQKPGDQAEDASESREQFYTNAGRVVYGGGGITPDFDTALQEYPRLITELSAQNMFVKFASHFSALHPALDRRTFKADEALIKEFRTFLRDQSFTYQSAAELELKKLDEIARKRQFNQSVFKTIATLRVQLHAQHDADFKASRDLIRAKLGAEIGAKLWGSDGRYSYWVQHDPQVLTAVDILMDQEKYRQQLSNQSRDLNRTGLK